MVDSRQPKGRVSCTHKQNCQKPFSFWPLVGSQRSLARTFRQTHRAPAHFEVGQEHIRAIRLKPVRIVTILQAIPVYHKSFGTSSSRKRVTQRASRISQMPVRGVSAIEAGILRRSKRDNWRARRHGYAAGPAHRIQLSQSGSG